MRQIAREDPGRDRVRRPCRWPSRAWSRRRSACVARRPRGIGMARQSRIWSTPWSARSSPSRTPCTWPTPILAWVRRARPGATSTCGRRPPAILHRLAGLVPRCAPLGWLPASIATATASHVLWMLDDPTGSSLTASQRPPRVVEEGDRRAQARPGVVLVAVMLDAGEHAGRQRPQRRGAVRPETVACRRVALHLVRRRGRAVADAGLEGRISRRWLLFGEVWVEIDFSHELDHVDPTDVPSRRRR